MAGTQEVIEGEVTQHAPMEATQEASMEATQEASEDNNRTATVFKEEDVLKLVEFLKDNKLLYQRLMDYKDPYKIQHMLSICQDTAPSFLK